MPSSFGSSSGGALAPATWETGEAIRAHTGLPVVFEEVLTVEDACRVAEADVDGIAVSNHGGRAVGRRGARQALEPRAVQLATDLVGHGSRDPEQPAATDE